MSPKVLALIEDNIGTKLLLATRLKTLGYRITILSAPVAFRQRVEADSFDWVILDDAVVPPVRRRFLEHLQRHRKNARIVWCGRSPRRTSVPIEATFEKPLRYDEIERFFSQWAAPDTRGVSDPGDAMPWRPAGKPKGPPHCAEGESRKTSVDTSPEDGTTKGDEKQ
jgi:hypothetical protein